MPEIFDYSWDSENSKIYKSLFRGIHTIDCHVHIGKDQDGLFCGAKSIIKSMNDANISKSIIFPFNDVKKGTDYHKPNDVVLRAYKKHSSRFIPFFRLNPLGEWKKEFDLRVKQGFIGIKLHPVAEKFKLLDKEAQKVYKAAEEANLVLLVHAGLSMDAISEEIKIITEKFPNLKIILGHAAFIDMRNAVKAVGDNTNVFFDVSSLKVFDLYKLFKTLPAKRIIFGSDYPYYYQSIAIETMLDTALICRLTPNMIQGMLGDNLLRWLEPYEKENKKEKKYLVNLEKIKKDEAKIEEKGYSFFSKAILDLVPRNSRRGLLKNPVTELIDLLSYVKNRKRLETQVQYLRIYSLVNRGEVLLIQKSFKRAFNRFRIMKRITEDSIERKEAKYIETIRSIAKHILDNRAHLIKQMSKGIKLNQTKTKAHIHLIKNICILRILKN